MLPRGSLVPFLWVLAHFTVGQNVQWASRLIDFSDEFSPLEFSSDKILGEPNVLPNVEINANAWSPGRPKKEHFIVVGFNDPMFIRQVALAEAFNPGALKQVYAIDPEDNSHLLFSLKPKVSQQKGRMFNFFISKTPFPVAKLRLVFDGRLYDGRFYIDAVAISDSEKPVRVNVKNIPTMRSDLKAEALDSNINSSFSEIRPLLTPDGSALYFSRKNHQDNLGGKRDEEDIWRSSWNGEAWGPAENLGAPLNNSHSNFINSFSSQGNMLLAIVGNEYSSSGKVKPGVSVSNSTEAGWSDPVKLDFIRKIDPKGNFDFTLSPDRKVIIFAVKGSDSYGDKDLYVSFLQRSGFWSEPLNLGTALNTVNEESSPFLADNGTTLYFASHGFSGYGGTDIYRSERQDDSWQNWNEPENLGPPINSSYDEKYFNIPKEGNYAYFSRYLEENNADVFRVDLPLYEVPVHLITVNARLVDELTGNPVEGRVKTASSGETLTGNSFRIKMQSRKIYQCLIEADGYMTHRETLDLTTEDLSDILEIEIKLKRQIETLTFENLNFASNEAVLLDEAYPDLEKIVKILKENPAIRVEVASHTDNVGSEENNIDLSRKRAEIILEYLTGNAGIASDRISLSWFGESKPIASNETEEGRKKNRRVEFIIKR